jgi:hypothetical protein
MRQRDTVVQGSVQQQLAAGRQKTLAVNRYLMMNCQ